MLCFCIVAFVAMLYIFFDVNYFGRIIFTILWGRFLQKKIKLFDESCIYGICTTQDIDLVLKHMNNARYLRELDFARFSYYDRSGIYSAIVSNGGSAVQGASSIRYRRAIPLLCPYKITTQLIFWDDKSFYLEQKFISLTDNFVRSVCLSKQVSTGLKITIPEIIAKLDSTVSKPEITDELRLWIESMEQSSQKLKKQN